MRRELSSTDDKQGSTTLGHRSRESNRTLDQQTFWKKLREDREDDMSGLFASRWAATPPAEEGTETNLEEKPNPALSSSQWAVSSPPPEPDEKPLESGGIFASRWADTPSPDNTVGEKPQSDDGVAEREAAPVVETTHAAKDEGGEPGVGVGKKTATENASGSAESVSVAAENPGKNVELEQPTTASNVEPTREVLVATSSPSDIKNDTADVSAATESIKAATVPETDIAVQSSPDKAKLTLPRTKKKVIWRGKACTILIPEVDYAALGFTPFSDSEAKARLKSFEDQGLDTSGFDTAPDESAYGAVHIKPIYPDEAETDMAARQQGTKVLLPDLKKWAAYMDHLTEQKLAALGVSLGGDEPTSAGGAEMSRQSSAQYPPLPFSPPIPSNSVNSMGRPGMIRGHSHTMSVSSPISPLHGPGGHMRTQSTFAGPMSFQSLQQGQAAGFPGLRTFTPPSQQFGQQPPFNGLQSLSPPPQQLPQQPILPGMQSFSPHGQFAVPGFNRAGSPAQLAALRNVFGEARGPGSPLSQQVVSQSPQDHGNPHMQYFPNTFAPLNTNIQQSRALPELPEEEDEDELAEKPIQPATALDSEPETPSTYVPPHKRAQLNADIAVPTPRGHRHNISEGLEREILEAEKRHEAERRNWIEVEEEESSERQSTDEAISRAAPVPQPTKPVFDELDPLSQGISVQESVHAHKRSGSRINAPAPAFKFNPGASFQPGSTSFAFNPKAPASNAPPVFGHNRGKSSLTLNVAAPEFKPSAPVFKPAGFSALPKSEFSFSASGPSFNPDVPAFKPRDEVQTVADTLGAIFGKVEIPDIVKPARRSKAVAIIRPDDKDTKSGSGTDFEDEDGRITQREDRMKRQRQVDDDGDEVPRFAEPTPLPAPPPLVLKSQREDGAENDAVNDAKPATYKFGDIGDVWTPPDSSKSVRPDPPKPSHGHRHSSSLSALAKPFEPFGPSNKENVPTHEATQGFASISELEEGEIKDDSHPTTSPPEPHRQDEVRRAVSPVFPAAPSFDIPVASARVDTVSELEPEPSFDEIDAVMRRLNEAGTPQGLRDINDISPVSSLGAHPMEGVTYLPGWSRSDAPSPSPRRREAPPNPQADSSFTIHDRTDSAETPVHGWPDLSRMNKTVEAPTSDWSGVFSAQDEEKLQHRGQFFDSHIDKLIGDAVERRLQPLEESLRSIQQSVVKRPMSRDTLPKRSSSAIESDADDEDDYEAYKHRPISRGKDKRVDQIKAAVLDALREQGPQPQQQSLPELAELHSVLADMKMSFARAASTGLELDDIRAVVEETVSKQSQAVIPVSADPAKDDMAHKREISELEGRLNETLAGALEEANRRRSVEEREVEAKRMLRLAEEELQLVRDSSRDHDSRLQAAEKERENLLRRLERAEKSQREMEEQVKGLEAEHEAAQGTLEEYRISSNRWRQDIDNATQDREELENTIATLERELEESQEMGGSMRRRLEKLHSDMSTAAGQLASEKASRQEKEDEYRTRCEQLEVEQQTQLKEKENLQQEAQALRAGTADAIESRAALEQMKVANASLEEMVRTLQANLVEQKTLASRFERDFKDAREAGRSEVERTRISMEADVEAANLQVNVVRIELESELTKVRAELEHARMEAETTKARHERHLEDEETAKRDALRKINQSSSVALDDARQKHEVSIHELTAAHKRALDHAIEDKQRSEYILNERLSLSDAKLQHFHDRVLHLEERLEVTKSAAQAAASSATSRGLPATAPTATSRYNSLPEKISPQALRESILVLQEQLQERESTIDNLRSKVENPAEIKKRDDEIAWLRELLEVRSEELTDLVNTLAQPAFDRAAIRDTAIRIRANLQMEQQEKERFNQSSSIIPGQAIASLSNFATPKAAQLGAAFSKWRANMESSALKNAPRGNARPRSSTPSKPPSAPSRIPEGYSAGLMTPPASNIRGTPSPEITKSLPAPRLNSSSGEKSQARQARPSFTSHSRQASGASQASQGSNTQLFRSQSYDNDAEDSKMHMQSFDDEDLDVADNQPPAFRSLEDELDAADEDDNMA